MEPAIDYLFLIRPCVHGLNRKFQLLLRCIVSNQPTFFDFCNTYNYCVTLTNSTINKKHFSILQSVSSKLNSVEIERYSWKIRLSSNVIEVIRPILDFLYFFTKGFYTHKRHKKVSKAPEKNLKHLKELKN